MSDASDACGAEGPNNPRNYTWIVVAGGVFSFIMAYGIGANDVANAFATSVGSKTLKLWQAVCIATVFEFTGSMMGAQVTNTIAGGITDPEQYQDEPAVLMLGMLTALMGAGLWVLIATRLALPVSTTHAIIGSIVGFGVVARGFSSINWAEIGVIVISWVTSPLLAGLFSSAVFFLVRLFILRSVAPLARGFLFYPLLVFATVAVNTVYVTTKGLAGVGVDLPGWLAWVIGIGVALLVAVLVQLLLVPWLKHRLLTHTWGPHGAVVSSDYGTMNSSSDGIIKSNNVVGDDVSPVEVADDEPLTHGVAVVISSTHDDKFGGSSSSIPISEGSSAPLVSKSDDSFLQAQWRRMMGDDMEETAFENEAVKEIHAQAEVFNSKAEHIFSYLQVVTACCMSFAHGSNDVANSVGPFSAIINIYDTCSVSSDSQVPIWILVMGGGGIVLGLLTYGYHVMRSIGMELIKITPSRGFCIEFSSATVIILGSSIGIPLSSTHCQVGSTVGVGLLEGKNGFNMILFAKTFTSWVFTLIFSSIVTAGIFAFAYFAP